MLQKHSAKIDNNLDFVEIQLGQVQQRIGYRVAFEIEQAMRLGAKQAARADRANGKFWTELELDDLRDCPKPHRGMRQSLLRPTCRSWEVFVEPPLVGLRFDGSSVKLDYESAIKVGHAIRRAGRRAKAWAGDTATYSKMLGYLTDAEEDYKLFGSEA